MRTRTLLLVSATLLLSAGVAVALPTDDEARRWAADAGDLARGATALSEAVLADPDGDDVLDRLVADDIYLFGRYAGFLEEILEEYADALGQLPRVGRPRVRWRLAVELVRRMRRVMLDIDAGLVTKERRVRRRWFSALRSAADDLSLDILEDGAWWTLTGGRPSPWLAPVPRRGYVRVATNRPYRPDDLSGRASHVIIEAVDGDILVHRITYESVVSWRGIVGLRERNRITVNRIVEDGEQIEIHLRNAPRSIDGLEIHWDVQDDDPYGRVTVEED